MASTTDQLKRLSADSDFRQRVRNIALIVAAAVMAEAGNVVNHSQRVAYAKLLIDNPSRADQIADFLCGRVTITGANTTYDFGRGNITSDATDIGIQGQIQNDWNTLSGVPANP